MDTPNSTMSPLAASSSALGGNLETSGNNELELDFQPRVTAYEKAKASSLRLFGNREKKFGGGNIRRKNFGRSGRIQQQNLTLREELASPVEFVRRRLSETPDFADCIGETKTKKLFARQRSFTSDGPSKIAPRRRLQRTVSLQATSTTLDGEGFSNVPSFASLVEENLHPNVDGPPDLPRDRKKIKSRRHSYAVPTQAPRQLSSSSDSSNFPPDLQWLAPMQTPMSNTNDSAEAFAALSQGSVGSLSTTPSRRKRGVFSSPHSSETEDYLHYSGSSYSGSRRSRSRIFSLEDSIQPCRTVEDDPMGESSGEESYSSSPDTSMEMDAIPRTPAPLPKQPKTILETMPSMEDLAFLVQELKKSSEGPLFGSNALNVVPPSNRWSSQRRSHFVSWTTTSLGFTRCSAGTGYPYVRISKTRGLQILVVLEAAKREYKEMPSVENEPETRIFSAFKSPLPTPAVKDPMSEMKSETNLRKTTNDSIAMDLTDRLASLTFDESKRETVARTVSIHPPCDTLSNGRPSLGTVASTQRSSMGSQFGATDLNLQMFGISPRVGGTGRSAKMSFGSWSSSIHSGSSNPQAQGMTPCAERLKLPLTSVKFAGTPMNKECRMWGSRPVLGRDWGTSEICDPELVAAYVELFKQACESEEMETEFLFTDNVSSSSFDFESDGVVEQPDNLALSKVDADRVDKKKRCSVQKRRRISLFATASGVQAGLRHKKFSPKVPTLCEDDTVAIPAASAICKDDQILPHIFSFMNEDQLLTTASSVCTYWSKAATNAHVNLLLRSIQNIDACCGLQAEPILERSWQYMHEVYPWASYLAEGGAKRVYKVYNSTTNREEALSVMDVSEMENVQIVANELAVAAMLSSFVRRNICPNFINMRSVFTCAYPPPESCWGTEDNKFPRGNSYDKAKKHRKPRVPKIGHPGRYQYISMELVNEGDAEEFIKRQEEEKLSINLARSLLFQIAFSLFAAADKFSVKHYDVKLLNIFVHKLACPTPGGAIFRYGVGSHVFALPMAQESVMVAKLADFGTANADPSSSGQPVGIAHFTTLENTPPDFFIVGDDAQQGHEHDSFGLGLCMLHLFTGYRPYEEILESVRCPPNLKKRLSAIWEDESQEGFSVINSIIFDGVDEDEDGNFVDEPDQTFYDTLYRFLVLFGIPDVHFKQKTHSRVWKAITDSLVDGKKSNKTSASDKQQFTRDCKRYSISRGSNKYIARARDALTAIDGGLDLLFDLCSFDPSKRATPLQVLNSKFMADLREDAEKDYGDADIYSYMSFATTGV